MTQTPLVAPRGRGRPKKFAGPSRHVTLTLPEHVIAALSRTDSDLSRAIVRAAERTAGSGRRGAAELSRFGRRAVIVVDRSRTLEQRADVDLIPLPDGRALISFDRARTLADLELTISDALGDRKMPARDREVFEGVASILKEARHSPDVMLRQRSIIVIEARRRPRKR